MRILITLPLYVLRELGKAFALSLIVYSFILLAMSCGQILQDGATLFTVLRMIPYMFPLISPMALPLSMITAILICYGRFSADNEFMAAQASGINPRWLAVPALIVACLAAMVSVFFNADVLTRAVNSIEQSLLADRAAILHGRLRRPGSFGFPVSETQTLVISRLPKSWDAKRRDGIDITDYRLVSPNATDSDAEVTGDAAEMWDLRYPYPTKRALAKDHKILVNEDVDRDMLYLQIDMTEGMGMILDSQEFSPGTSGAISERYSLPSADVSFQIASQRLQYMGIERLLRERTRRDDELGELMGRRRVALQTYLDLVAPLVQLPGGGEAVREMRSRYNEAVALQDSAVPALAQAVRALDQAARAAGRVPPAGAQRQLAYDQEKVSYCERLAHESRALTAQIHMKLVFSFACIAFAVIGIPLGLVSKRKSTMIGFAFGLGISFLFYMVSYTLHNAVRDGDLPWVGMWIPIPVMLLIGVVLWQRSQRDMA